MKKKWVILRIETKSREFLSKSLIAYELVREGFGVIITNKLGIDISLFPKGAYLINALFSNGYKYVNILKRNGQKIIFLDEEGLVYLSEDRFINKLDVRSLQLVDQIYCFGNQQASLILKHFPDLADKVFITGNPRLNLLNKTLLPLICDDSESIKQRYPHYILIVSNFTIANLDGAGKTFEEKKHIAQKLFEHMNIASKDVFFEQFEYVYKQMNFMKELILAIHSKFPDKTIIVRPHPSEDVETWKEFASDYCNIEIIREGTMFPWLVNADLVIQNSCTSAIECMYLHAPCISYRPIMDSHYDQPLPNLLSKNVFTQEEALEVIDKILAGGKVSFDFSEYEEKAKDYVANQKGNLSAQAIVNNIKKLALTDDEYSVDEYKRRKYSINRIPYLLKEYAKIIVKLLPDGLLTVLPSNIQNKCIAVKQDNGGTKYEGVNASNVMKVFKDISRLNDSKDNFNVEQIGDEILIYR